MLWDREMLSFLISVVREKPSLWDVRCEGFHKRYLKKQALTEVLMSVQRIYPQAGNLTIDGELHIFLVIRAINVGFYFSFFMSLNTSILDCANV